MSTELKKFMSNQAVPFEINLRKKKWPMISIYRPPSQKSKMLIFIKSLTNLRNFLTII